MFTFELRVNMYKYQHHYYETQYKKKTYYFKFNTGYMHVIIFWCQC